MGVNKSKCQVYLWTKTVAVGNFGRNFYINKGRTVNPMGFYLSSRGAGYGVRCIKDFLPVLSVGK
jgi:hypothetical protein